MRPMGSAPATTPAPPSGDDIRELLRQQFPESAELAALLIQPLDTGGEHYTFAVGDDLVFRFPKDEATAAKTAREIAVLAALAPALPLPVPAVRYVGSPSARFPFVFAGQQRIRGLMGETLRPPRAHWPRLARQLGEFFAALHHFPMARALELDLPRRPMEPAQRLIADVTRYRRALGAALPAGLREAAAPYLDGAVPVPPPMPLAASSAAGGLVVSHSDLKGEHIFVSLSGTEVTGVVDWSDAALCEPQVDLQDLMIWLGAGFLRQVLPHYFARRGAIDDDSQDLAEDLFRRAVPYRRYECLRALGVRLAGDSDDPPDLLLTQLRWAFTNE